MIVRRDVLKLAAGALIALATPVRGALAQGAGEQAAAAFMQNVAQQLVTVVNGPGSDAEKKQKMAAIIDKYVDVESVGEFCLGRYWRLATPEQRSEYLALFHSVLVKSITGHLGEYQGVSVAVGKAEPQGDGSKVTSIVSRPNNQPADVDWIISTDGGSPKIQDVVAEGTSLRLTQRSDYASYLSRNGNNVQALIDALKQQVQQNG